MCYKVRLQSQVDFVAHTFILYICTCVLLNLLYQIAIDLFRAHIYTYTYMHVRATQSTVSTSYRPVSSTHTYTHICVRVHLLYQVATELIFEKLIKWH